MGTNILISPQLLGLTGLIPLKGPKKHSGNSNGCEFRIFSVVRGTNIYKKSLLPRSIEGMTKTSTIFIGDIRPFATDHSYSVPAFPTADADSTICNSVWWLPIFKSYRHKKHVVVWLSLFCHRDLAFPFSYAHQMLVTVLSYR